MGGTKFDELNALALDAVGNIYAVGRTYSNSGIAAGGIYDGTLNGLTDGFVVKFNPAGVRQWGFYFGSLDAGLEEANAIAIRGDRLIIGGQAGGTGLGTPGTFQPTQLSASDGFIAEFNLAGELKWSTYVGSTSGSNVVNSLAIADNGALYACGRITSGGMVADGASHQPVYGGNGDGFLLRLDTAGKRVWGTYYGGNGAGNPETCTAVVHRPGVGVFMAGRTDSVNNISTLDAPMGLPEAWVARFYENGIREWGRYFGGGGSEVSAGLALHPAGGLVLAVDTSSYNLSTDGTVQNGDIDLLLARISDAGATTWATYLGGKYLEIRGGLAVAQDGAIYYTGTTRSSSKIATPDAYQTENLDGYTGFFGRIDPDGAHAWATYWGGIGVNHQDHLLGAVLLGDGSLVVTGVSNATGLASPGAHQVALGGDYDGLLGRFAPQAPPKDPLGAPCVDPNTCESEFCADGVCCDDACGDGDPNDCQACSMAEGAPADGICAPKSMGSECRPSSGECDAAEACNGVGLVCPVDAPEPDGTPCTLGLCADGLCLPDGGSTTTSGDSSSSGGSGMTGGSSSSSDASTASTTDVGTATSNTGEGPSSSTGQPGDTGVASESGGGDTSAQGPSTSGGPSNETDPEGVTGGAASTGGSSGETGTQDGGGCGCDTAPASGLLGLLGLALRRRRRKG